MFAYQNFNSIHIPFPSKGMNRDISSQHLPPENAWYLENFTQDSLGEGLMRYGVRQWGLLSTIDDGFVLKAFPYLATAGKEQLVLYVNVYKQVTTLSLSQVVIHRGESDISTIYLKGDGYDKFRPDTFVKVTYNNYNNAPITQHIKLGAIKAVKSDTKEIEFFTPDVSFVDALGVNDFTAITSISNSVGEIHVVDVESSTFTKVFDGLRVDCIPRAVSFMQKLVICNGLDPMMQWDGSNITVIFEWVKEKVTGNITKSNNFAIDFTCPNNPQKWASQKSIFFNGIEHEIINVGIAGNTVGITCATNIGNVPTQIFFKSFPPLCNFLHVFQDRLWGLGQGAASIEFRDSVEAMKVYYSPKPNMINSWIDEEKQTYTYLDLSGKHGTVDNLESIVQLGNRIVFVGREKSQVYGGLIADKSFSWLTTVDSGTFNGDLVFNLANDINFINLNGWASFSTLNIGNQFAVSGLTAINSLLKQQAVSSMQNNVDYRSSFVFSYKLGSFVGLRVGKNFLNHALYGTQPYFFSVFTGDFDVDFICPLGNRLYLFDGKNILIYGDGRDGNVKVYDDRGKAIVASWGSTI